MSKVVTYANNNYQCYCQLKLDSGERVLISIANIPTPTIKVIKLLFGFIPLQTIWEYNPTMAGGYDAYVQNMIKIMLFLDPLLSEAKHPLDALRDRLLLCGSISEIQDCLFKAEHNLSE